MNWGSCGPASGLGPGSLRDVKGSLGGLSQHGSHDFLKRQRPDNNRATARPDSSSKEGFGWVQMYSEEFRGCYEGSRVSSIEHELGFLGASSQDGFGGAQSVF